MIDRPDPIQLPEEPPPVRRRAPRDVTLSRWYLVALAILALFGLALYLTRPAPRPGSVIPSVGPYSPLAVGAASEADQSRTGAPQSRERCLSAQSDNNGSYPPTGPQSPCQGSALLGGSETAGSSGAPPTAMTVAPAMARNPHLTPAPDGIGGEATWWDSFGSGLYAAIRPDLGHRGELAVVCGGEPFHCLTLPIITTCACLGPGSDRLIDLSLEAFASFAPPSRGVVRITLQVLP